MREVALAKATLKFVYGIEEGTVALPHLLVVVILVRLKDVDVEARHLSVERLRGDVQLLPVLLCDDFTVFTFVTKIFVN